MKYPPARLDKCTQTGTSTVAARDRQVTSHYDTTNYHIGPTRTCTFNTRSACMVQSNEWICHDCRPKLTCSQTYTVIAQSLSCLLSKWLKLSLATQSSPGAVCDMQSIVEALWDYHSGIIRKHCETNKHGLHLYCKSIANTDTYTAPWLQTMFRHLCSHKASNWNMFGPMWHSVPTTQLYRPYAILHKPQWKWPTLSLSSPSWFNYWSSSLSSSSSSQSQKLSIVLKRHR